ncbi:MAG: NIPSNAP family protein [Verrucomicrobiota bacterium]
MKSLILTLLSLAFFTAVSASERNTLYELRVYHAHPGKLDSLNERFKNHTVALFDKHGMTQLGYFVPINNEDTNILVYWLGFEDEQARKNAWEAFKSDPDWKAAYAASTEDGKLVAEIESLLLEATDYTPDIDVLPLEDDSRIFEWRTYKTNDGKLANLNARFRDHTCALFEKHGMENLAYWTYLPGQDASDTTLTYLIAHQNQSSRDAAFKAFSQDPDWQSARAASEENGRLLVKKGVESLMLVPTDYSPVR